MNNFAEESNNQSNNKSIQVQYRQRDSGKIIAETIFMEAGLRYLYENPLILKIFNLILNHAVICWLHSKWQDSKGSCKNIEKFAGKYKINLEEIELPISDYPNFNAFFSRRLRVGARDFKKPENILIAPADGKIIVYPDLGIINSIPVKGKHIAIAEILDNTKIANLYQNGSALVIRLSPSDYHRFHFIDDGFALNTRKIKGKYHSVNPIALATVPDIYCRNKRVLTEFHSNNSGHIIYIEVGAFCIGTIIQTFVPGKVYKGQEKGYFKYGGSTIILLFETGIIKFDKDLIIDSTNDLEIQVKAGDKIGKNC
ncbi:MAG: archaetidylserine decarboxylase [Cyanobacteria bacterium P01_A01_bin.84]